MTKFVRASRRVLAFLFATAAIHPLAAQDAPRPNILWITSEDNAAHWLGCYGNEDAHTPRLDALAGQSLQFMHAYSNAPVCAVARCTLLHGMYASTLGTQHMRSRYPIPASVKPYVSYLREAGYYCTNNSKTDYNRRGNDEAIWDVSSRGPTIGGAARGQPFFAIFNLTVTHESTLFPETVAANRRRDVIPQEPRLNPESLRLPPYLPDLPEVRRDVAMYHDCLTALDLQVGELLDELAENGLADDTIVFYFSDHGGATPRGKRYLYDTGVRVPLLVHIPEKWRERTPFAGPQKVDELVSFVDLAPTLLSLAGIEPPDNMQGRAFLGARREAPADEPVVLLFADRFDEIEGMDRGLVSGGFKYIRRFTPHLPAAPKSYYSLGVPSWAAWQQAWRDDRLPRAGRRLWESPQPVEELYDIERDPWEVDDLADDPAHADRLAAFRRRLFDEMLAVLDTSVIPEAMFRELAGDQTLYEYVRSPQCDYEQLLRVAVFATERDPANLPALLRSLGDGDPVERYWATLGVLNLGPAAAAAEPQLAALLDDPSALRADHLGHGPRSHRTDGRRQGGSAGGIRPAPHRTGDVAPHQRRRLFRVRGGRSAIVGRPARPPRGRRRIRPALRQPPC